MEPEVSLPQSQQPAKGSYPEPARSSPYPYITLPEDSSYCYPLIYAWVSPVVSFPQVSPVYASPLPSPIRATCPAHLIHFNLITRITMGEHYRSLSSSLYSFLQSPVTSSHLGPNILLYTTQNYCVGNMQNFSVKMGPGSWSSGQSL